MSRNRRRAILPAARKSGRWEIKAMMSVRVGAVAVAVFLLPAAHAAAQAPVALVEDVKGSPSGIEMMDYVVPGRVIKLGAADTITLGYLKSCWRETITGATVTVGPEQSDVQGGRVNRERVACDAGRMQLTAETASKGGAMVFREMPTMQRPSPLTLRPQFFLFGMSPAVVLAAGAPAIIERVDKPGERYQIVGDKLGGTMYDFAEHNQSLAKAGVYRATQGPVRVLFQIHLDAKSGQTPLLGRLLQLRSQG
jgi:hypothetical protein